jgi:hypothetical protein
MPGATRAGGCARAKPGYPPRESVEIRRPLAISRRRARGRRRPRHRARSPATRRRASRQTWARLWDETQSSHSSRGLPRSWAEAASALPSARRISTRSRPFDCARLAAEAFAGARCRGLRRPERASSMSGWPVGPPRPPPRASALLRGALGPLSRLPDRGLPVGRASLPRPSLGGRLDRRATVAPDRRSGRIGPPSHHTKCRLMSAARQYRMAFLFASTSTYEPTDIHDISFVCW